MKLAGILLAAIGVVLLIVLGAQTWDLAPPEYFGLSVGKILVVLAAVVGVGLGLAVIARDRAATSI